MATKRRTEKVQAKIVLLDMYNRHAFLDQPKLLKKALKMIKDEDLEFLVNQFVQAKKDLDAYLDQVRTDVAPFLPDDSDF